jgi:hypothetical protein
MLKIDENTDQLVESNPTTASIAGYASEDYFLNNTLGGAEEIAEDYSNNRVDVIYARVTQDSGNPIIQYWFFYAFNPGSLNQHQGDWEMIQIILDSSDSPSYAVFSQHFTGEQASWPDIEKVDQTHPRVYVALGSHANYFRPYQGKLGIESDIVGNAEEISYNVLLSNMVILGEMGFPNHPSTQDWLEYGGRWGDWAELADVALGAAGPTGPGQGENEKKWDSPYLWGSDLFQVNQSWFIASWILYYFLYIFAGILAILVVIKIWRIVKRKKQGKLNLMGILRSKAGVGVILGIAGIIIYLIALLLPWYLVTGTIDTTVGLQTDGEQNLVLIDGINGIQVNTLQSDQGLAQLFGLGIPLSIILLASVILNFLDLVGVDKAKSLSRKFLMSGITSLIPVILILVFILQLATIIPPFASALGGGDVPPQVDILAGQLSANPIMGQYTTPLDSLGNLDLSWGLALGSYLFIVAAILKLSGGIITRAFAKSVVTKKAEEPETPPPPPKSSKKKSATPKKTKEK